MTRKKIIFYSMVFFYISFLNISIAFGSIYYDSKNYNYELLNSDLSRILFFPDKFSNGEFLIRIDNEEEKVYCFYPEDKITIEENFSEFYCVAKDFVLSNGLYMVSKKNVSSVNENHGVGTAVVAGVTAFGLGAALWWLFA